MPYSDPDRARDYQREYRRTRRSGDDCTTPGTTPIPLPFRLQTAADVLKLLEEQVTAVRAEQEVGTLEKARAIGYLAGITLKAIEAGNLAARLEMLETVLKQQWRRPAMNTKAIAKLYDRLAPLKRLPLIVAAAHRGDEAEGPAPDALGPKGGVQLPRLLRPVRGVPHLGLVASCRDA